MTVSEPRVGCGAAIVIDRRILLIRRLTDPEAGAWSLPGGKVDLYEAVPRAVEREVAEELGIVIVADDLLCVVDHIGEAQGYHWVAPVYRVGAFTGEPQVMEPTKHDAVDWFALDDLPSPLAASAVAAVSALRS